MNLKNIIKTLFFITIITIVVSSFNVYATGDEEIDGDLPTVLLLADFEEAQEQEGETTLKGITYRGGDFYMNAGNYILGGDIVFDSEWADYIEFPEGDSVLDLNGHTIGLSILVYQHGEIESSLTINGNGTVNSSVISADSGSITINGGTYHGVLNVGYEATMTINNATVNIIGDETDLDEIDPAIFASDGAVLVINDGTFTTKGYTALWADVYDSEPAKSIEINGGTFTGSYYGIDAEACKYLEINDGTFIGTQMSGINIGDCDSVDINGGEFKGAMTGLELNSTTAVVSLTGGTFTSLDGYHSADGLITSGILLLSVGENEEAFDELLVDGYKYDPEIEVACAPTRLADEETGEPCYMPYTNQATISVIEDNDVEDEENPEEQDDEGEEDSEEKVIDLVEFTISNPEAGTNVTIEETAYSTIQKPQPTVKISSDAEYQIPALNGAIVTYWVTSDSKEDDEWFEGEFIEGEKYIAEVCLIAKSGYRFSKDVEVIVNGDKVSNFYLSGTDEEGLSSTITIFHSLEAEGEKEISNTGDEKSNGVTDNSETEMKDNNQQIPEETNEEENKTTSEEIESANPQTGDGVILICLNTIIIAILGILATKRLKK